MLTQLYDSSSDSMLCFLRCKSVQRNLKKNLLKCRLDHIDSSLYPIKQERYDGCTFNRLDSMFKRSRVIREFQIHVWCFHHKCRTTVSSLWLEVRSFETSAFQINISFHLKKNQHVHHHLELYKGWRSFISKHKIWLKDWFSSFPNILFIGHM